MNHIEQLAGLKEQLQSLKDFMSICPDYALPKLMREAHVILNRINHIKEMDFKSLTQEVPFYFETKQSKSNFKTI